MGLEIAKSLPLTRRFFYIRFFRGVKYDKYTEKVVVFKKNRHIFTGSKYRLV